jgi:hypothetical protein
MNRRKVPKPEQKINEVKTNIARKQENINEGTMEGRIKQAKTERVTEVNVYKSFGNVKRMSGRRLSRRILKWEA